MGTKANCEEALVLGLCSAHAERSGGELGGSAGSGLTVPLLPSSAPPPLTCDIFSASAPFCIGSLGLTFDYMRKYQFRPDRFNMGVYRFCSNTVYNVVHGVAIKDPNQFLLSAPPWKWWRAEKRRRRWWRWTWLPG